jgi:hypothetical protein
LSVERSGLVVDRIRLPFAEVLESVFDGFCVADRSDPSAETPESLVRALDAPAPLRLRQPGKRPDFLDVLPRLVNGLFSEPRRRELIDRRTNRTMSITLK